MLGHVERAHVEVEVVNRAGFARARPGLRAGLISVSATGLGQPLQPSEQSDAGYHRKDAKGEDYSSLSSVPHVFLRPQSPL
jgi:hypothetical protein